MKKMYKAIVLGMVIIISQNIHAQKKPLSIQDIEAWKRITETVVSADGKWIAYNVEPWRGDSHIFLYDSKGEKKFESSCGKDINITRDSEFMIFTMVPEYKTVRELKIRKSGNEEIPRNKLGIYALQSGKLDTIQNIKSYKLPGNRAEYLAFQLEKPWSNSEYEIKTKTGNKAAKQGDEGRLFLLNLFNKETLSWPSVTDYSFSEENKKLCFSSTGDEEDFYAGIYIVDCETGNFDTIMSGENEYRQLTISKDGSKVAFLAKPVSQNETGDFSLFLWSGNGVAKEVVNNHRKEIPNSWRISENGKISCSDNGQRIFFGLAPLRPKRDPGIPDDEFPGVDIWHGGEGTLHTAQVINRDRDLKQTYLTMYDINTGMVLQIETEDIPKSGLIGHGDADYAFLYTGKPYELESMWNPRHYDIYLINLVSGSKQLIKKNIRSGVKSSPGGEYLIWFDYNDYSYNTYHIKTGKEYRITEPGIIRAEIETNTTFDVQEPYGSPGWLENDGAVLIYDRYDIWRVDPQKNRPPVNLTVNGRKTNTAYRLVRFNMQEEVFKEEETQLLTGVNEISRSSGYYRLKMNKGEEPESLIKGDYNLSIPVKAEKAGTVVYTKETFKLFPDLILSDMSLRKHIRISNANPQQDDFIWGTAEIYQWHSLDGRKLEGMLFKPENFDPSQKYPMIVTFFHKSSDQLHNHRVPEYNRSRIDYHLYTSNGYVVFNPDVYFDLGYIGESAYKSVMPGITALIKEGFVDPGRIGAGGHSYSGYQLAYMATRSNIFACIEAGAPVVNWFSSYGGIHWGDGTSRAIQYEHDQALAHIWDAPLRYIENSPLLAMDKVNTPILIMHNDNDTGVPWYQGIEFFIALRRLHKTVWMLNYNGEPHNLAQLKNKKDFQIRLSQFFDHYLKGTPMPEWMKRGVPAVEKDYNLGYDIIE